ncbi:MAG: ABC transporter ATP-binding protein [Nocardioidaceae bacterium]
MAETPPHAVPRALATTSADASSPSSAVADVAGLHVAFTRDGCDLEALRGVDLRIQPGEIVGLVGESGSGKTVLGLSMLGLLPKTARIEGTVTVDGVELNGADETTRRRLRRRAMGAVFQDPMTSLDPTMRIGKQVHEVAGSTVEVLRLLEAVGIGDAQLRLRDYPHELSGGLRQRVMLAIALAARPKLVIADEPTTALDVTVQAQVLTLFRLMRDEFGCAILLVTHDLAVASTVADRLCVLYGGLVSEVGKSRPSSTVPPTRIRLPCLPRASGCGQTVTRNFPSSPENPFIPLANPSDATSRLAVRLLSPFVESSGPCSPRFHSTGGWPRATSKPANRWHERCRMWSLPGPQPRRPPSRAVQWSIS